MILRHPESGTMASKRDSKVSERRIPEPSKGDSKAFKRRFVLSEWDSRVSDRDSKGSERGFWIF